MEFVDWILKNADGMKLGVLTGIILVLGYYEVWVYGKTHRRDIENLQKQLDRSEARCTAVQQELQMYQQMLLRGNYISEKSVQLAETAAGKLVEVIPPKG
jgi:hypothetical protein